MKEYAEKAKIELSGATQSQVNYYLQKIKYKFTLNNRLYPFNLN